MPHPVLTRHEVTTRLAESQQVAAVRKRTSMATIGEDIAAGFDEIAAAMHVQRTRSGGSPFIVFHGRIDDVSGGVIEMCRPVASAFHGVGEVYAARISGGIVASTIHRGSYDEMAPAYEAIMAWMDEHDHEPDGPPREHYLNDPETTKEDDLLTEVVFPIR
jgi:effector-binding domain-containing protein